MITSTYDRLSPKYFFDRDTERTYRVPVCFGRPSFGHAPTDRFAYDVSRYDVLVFECELCDSQVVVPKVG